MFQSDTLLALGLLGVVDQQVAVASNAVVPVLVERAEQPLEALLHSVSLKQNNVV